MAPARSRRGLVFRITTAVATLVLAPICTLLLMEGALRVYHRAKLAWAKRQLPPVAQRALVPSDDPELVYEFNPGWRKDQFTINSHGMPDRERDRAKPDGLFRIAFVGDSISASFGHVPRESIYLSLVERQLNRGAPDGIRGESLNFGVNGYGILQNLRQAQTRVRPFDPDLVVV